MHAISEPRPSEPCAHFAGRYGGIQNAIAVEFDTWYDAELNDPYENHVAVLTRGVNSLRADHGSHIGSCLDVPDITDGCVKRAGTRCGLGVDVVVSVS